MSATTAEEYKALGNSAFASKNYESAIEHYTKAIQLDPSNHVFYSNRSASHGGLENWDQALKDAKECIRLDPTFVKGYYRVATAQLELKTYDAAINTIKQGLQVDPNNDALLKLLKKARQLRKQSTFTSKTASSTTTPKNAAATAAVDPSISQELYDLQQAQLQTSREYNLVKNNIAHANRQAKAHEFTKKELDGLSSQHTNTYRSIGKMFLLQTKDEIAEYLDTEIESETKREADLQQKLEYLERRLKSQQVSTTLRTKLRCSVRFVFCSEHLPIRQNNCM